MLSQKPSCLLSIFREVFISFLHLTKILNTENGLLHLSSCWLILHKNNSDVMRYCRSKSRDEIWFNLVLKVATLNLLLRCWKKPRNFWRQNLQKKLFRCTPRRQRLSGVKTGPRRHPNTWPRLPNFRLVLFDILERWKVVLHIIPWFPIVHWIRFGKWITNVRHYLIFKVRSEMWDDAVDTLKQTILLQQEAGFTSTTGRLVGWKAYWRSSYPGTFARLLNI